MFKMPRSNSTKFFCSSLKDIDELVKPKPEPESSKAASSSSSSSSIYHRVRFFHPLIRSLTTPRKPQPPVLPKTIVLYHTTISIVRRTFEDCRTVKSILHGFRVPIDQRDLSMEPKYREELDMVTGCKNLTLPRVFIGGKYIGGRDEVQAMHECGELGKLIGALMPAMEPTKECKSCGGLGYSVCQSCNGSHKIYCDKSRDFNPCEECNPNGLVRCSGCCFSGSESV